jgi:transcriptional regulator with XRE-family HTH domain
VSASLRAPVHLSARLQAIFRGRGRVIGRGQREIADRMHLHNSILSLWVRGKRPVPGARIPALAAALEMTVEQLLDGVDVPRERVLPLAPAPSGPPPAPPAQPSAPVRPASSAIQEAAQRAAGSRAIVTHEALAMGPSSRCARGHYECVRTHAPQPHATVTRGPA